jgi:hypothetical protein
VDDLDGARARILLTKRILHWSPPTVAVEGLYPRVCAWCGRVFSDDDWLDISDAADVYVVLSTVPETYIWLEEDLAWCLARPK